MLKIKDLNVYYKNSDIHALKDINLKIENKEIYAIIGPSGCGKSTLLNTVATLNKNYTGEITLNDEVINPKKHIISFIPQNYGLLPWKTVYDNINIAIKIKSKNNEKDFKDKILNLMKLLKIDHLKNSYPGDLSGGQKQRVSIARSFSLNSDLLLMDEPFSALDALTREDTQELFLDIYNQNKVTTLFITHDVEEAIILGNKIVIMGINPGGIIEIIDNKTFNKKDKRNDKDFFQLSAKIRNIIKKEWSR